MNMEMPKGAHWFTEEIGGKEYIIREVEIWDKEIKSSRTIRVGAESLDKLIDEHGDTQTQIGWECREIDNTIFFFVEDEQIYLPCAELGNLIMKAIA